MFSKRRLLSLASIVFFAASGAFAFLTSADELMVLNSLQRLVGEEQLHAAAPISFDRISCKRSFCLIEARYFVASDDFGHIQNMKCVLEDVQSLFDVLDESAANQQKPYYPLQGQFFSSVQKCLDHNQPSAVDRERF